MRDWAALKREWLTGKYQSIKEFGEIHGIPMSTLTKQAWKYHWEEDRKKLETEIEQQARAKIAQELSEKILEAKKQHYEAGTALISLGLKKARDKGVNNPEVAVKIGADLRLNALGEATDRIEVAEELPLEVTEEDRALARLLARKLAKLRRDQSRTRAT